MGKESNPDVGVITVEPQNKSSLSVKHLLAKARVLSGSEVEESAALQAIEQESGTWNDLQAVAAPYDPKSLLRYIEITPHLRPCIDAMAQNIDGYGYRAVHAEPWMGRLDHKDGVQAVVEAIEIERWVAADEYAREVEREKGFLKNKIAELIRSKAPRRKIAEYQKKLDALEQEPPPDSPPVVDPDSDDVDDDVKAQIDDLKLRLTREKYLFDAWFKHCCSEMSFVDLRKAIRADIESHGWGAMEWQRDLNGRLKRLAYISGFTVRPLVGVGELISVAEDDSITPLSEDREVVVNRHFRLFVQQLGGKRIYFKSPGDPRVVSRITGRIYKSLSELHRPPDDEPPGEGSEAVAANELMWIAKHDPQTPCPPPDWVGNLLAVLGGREADETNFFYLNNQGIPAGFLFVSGGNIARGLKEVIEGRFVEEIKGAENSGKILVVEAKPGGQSAAPGDKTVQPTLTFQSLREATEKDALFLEYDKHNSDRIGASFRLSPMLRGYTPSNLNRATAFASLAFAEQQVFEPPRNSFDWLMNKMVLPEIGIRLWHFRSNSPPTRSAVEVAEFTKALGPLGAFTPAELREISSDVLNREFAPIDDDWTSRPLSLTLNGIVGDGAGASGDTGEIAERLRQIEMRFSEFITGQLREAGVDYDVNALFVDDPRENPDDENDGD